MTSRYTRMAWARPDVGSSIAPLPPVSPFPPTLLSLAITLPPSPEVICQNSKAIDFHPARVVSSSRGHLGSPPATRTGVDGVVIDERAADPRRRAPVRRTGHRRGLTPQDRGRGRECQQLGCPVPLRFEA